MISSELSVAMNWLASIEVYSEAEASCKELLLSEIEENEKRKDLLNAQAKIADILELPSSQKMVRFRVGYYIPTELELRKGYEDNTLKLIYTDVTNLIDRRYTKIEKEEKVENENI